MFNDGSGLTIASNGSYWTESPDAIKRASSRAQRELAHAEAELRGVLELAGALEEIAPQPA